MFVDIDETQSGRFLLISIGDHETSEIRASTCRPLRQADDDRAAAVGRQYSVEHHGDVFLILTNADGAEDFKIVTAPVASPAPANWRDLSAQARPLILSHVCLKGRLIRLEREDGLPRIVIRDLAERRREQHRLRRGGLWAGHGCRLRIRDGHAALHLRLDGAPGRDL
jgi:oligopeptidase B